MYVACDSRDQLQVSFLRSCPLSFALFETVSLVSPEVTIRLADQAVSSRDSCVSVLPVMRLQVHTTISGCLKRNVVPGEGRGSEFRSSGWHSRYFNPSGFSECCCCVCVLWQACELEWFLCFHHGIWGLDSGCQVLLPSKITGFLFFFF